MRSGEVTANTRVVRSAPTCVLAVFCVLCVLALSGGVCVVCFVFWPLLEELYLVENVTHCVFALKARRRRQFLGER